MVARGGLEIPVNRMYEMNASEKLNSLNAYVAGIGASKRVVVWDTTIRKMTTPQILFVFGHEMGHYVLGHMWLLIASTCATLLIMLFLGFHAMHWALARWGGRWAIRGIDDWASLPVLLLAVAVFGFFAEPLQSSFSRMLEHQADVYGLEVVHGIVPDSPAGCGGGVSDPGRGWVVGSESEPVHPILALRPPAGIRPRPLLVGVRPVGQRRTAAVCEVSYCPRILKVVVPSTRILA